MSRHVTEELTSQPDTWRRAAELAPLHAEALPQDGERVAVIGCGTSWFMAMCYAALRESRGLGETDAFAGSEFPSSRRYDRIVAISRSGTTTEVIDLLAAASGTTPTVVLVGTGGTPATVAADHTVLLDFADETSVVQTRFATTALTFLRAHLGDDGERLAQDAERALTIDVSDLAAHDQATFLGRGWTIGLAHEAALKCREAAQTWTESYPAMDYRHGPIAIAEPGRLVLSFGPPPVGLAADIAVTGADLVDIPDLDPQAVLVVAQRVAVAQAAAKGLDADRPRHLTRSVVLTDTPA